MVTDMLKHRIRAHRSAPDVYDPPTFEDMANRIEELEAEVKSMAMDCLVAYGQASDAYQAQLAAQTKLAKAVEALERADRAIMDTTNDLDLINVASVFDHMRTIRTTLAELKGDSDD